MSSCPTCGNRDHLCQQCKMDELEDRLGLPEDHFDADAGIVCWVQDLNDDWHASMYFEGTRHVSACGEIFETPVADVRDDPRRLPSTTTCDDCEAALEDNEAEVAADGGFEKASELATDGGEIDVYQWVLDNVHEYPAGMDSRWGSRGNLIHQGRKLDGVEKADVQEAIGRAVNNEDLISWHGLLAQAEVDRLRELVRVEHEEHDITRQILVGKCNKLIAKKKQEEADDGAEPEVATDGGLKEVFRRETIVAADDGMAIGEDAVPEDDREVRPDGGNASSGIELSDSGVAAAGGLVCQNFDVHDEEVKMVSGPYDGVQCPECGRMAGGGPPLDIPYVDEPGTPAAQSNTETKRDGGAR